MISEEQLRLEDAEIEKTIPYESRQQEPREMTDTEIKQRGIEDWSRNAQTIYDKYLRTFKININDRQLNIKQKNVCHEEDIGFTVWDGAIVLAKYFETLSPLFWQSKRSK